MITIEFNTISEILEAFPDEQTCIDHLEKLRWDGFVTSPFDASSKVYKCKNNNYKCKNSGKYFNAKTETIFNNSKVDLQKWFLAIWMVTSKKTNITSVDLGKELNITQKTAWYMIQRIKSYYKIEETTTNIKEIVNKKEKIAEKIEEIIPEKKQLLDWLASLNPKV
jgi:predicted transcriptional regulator